MTQRRLTTIVSVAYLATVLTLGLLSLRAYESDQGPQSSRHLTEAEMRPNVAPCEAGELWECVTHNER